MFICVKKNETEVFTIKLVILWTLKSRTYSFVYYCLDRSVIQNYKLYKTKICQFKSKGLICLFVSKRKRLKYLLSKLKDECTI